MAQYVKVCPISIIQDIFLIRSSNITLNSEPARAQGHGASRPYTSLR